MIFLMGEKVHRTAIDAGRHVCGVCKVERPFQRVVETNYFCLFGLRLLQIEKLADYLECEHCQTAFAADSSVPAALPLVQLTTVYILVGYGMHDHREVAMEICEKVTGFPFPEQELAAVMRSIDAGGTDYFEVLRRGAGVLNTAGKGQVIEAAFLMTYTCCEIQYEDRLRINLIANALGASIQFVESCIAHVRSESYYHVRRLLQGQHP